MELLIEYISRFIQKIVDSYGMGLTESGTESLIGLMAFLEAVVHVFGDVLGITGAFICIEGMVQLELGIDVGVCFMYHPNLGWAMYTYRGWSALLRVGYGLSIVAGFFTWHGEPDEFTFEKWEGKFIATEVSFIVTGISFHNENYSITGWGASAGLGFAVGSTGVHTRFWRAPDWMIPWWLKKIVVPQKS